MNDNLFFVVCEKESVQQATLGGEGMVETIEQLTLGADHGLGLGCHWNGMCSHRPTRFTGWGKLTRPENGLGLQSMTSQALCGVDAR